MIELQVGDVHFTGAEIAVITGMLTALGGAVAAMWFAYSKAMQNRIDGMLHDRDELRAIAWEAVELLRVCIAADPARVTPDQRQQVETLRQRALHSHEGALP